jgi:hypothetical protein
MTEKELEFFKAKMQKTKFKTQTDFILTLLKFTTIIVIENLNEVQTELKRHGNNLNQIARKLNEYGGLENNFNEVIKNCWNSYEQISNLEEVILNSIIQTKQHRTKQLIILLTLKKLRLFQAYF